MEYCAFDSRMKCISPWNRKKICFYWLLLLLSSPPPLSRTLGSSKENFWNKKPFFSSQPPHFLLGAERWFKRASYVRPKYFYRLGKELSCFRRKGGGVKEKNPQGFQLVLILFVMFMGTSHTCLAELRTWIFGRFFYDPILASFQDLQIASIICE